jgi:hypothetical protein
MGFVVLPILAVVMVGAGTWWLLSVDPAPVHPPALGFDVPHDRDLESVAFRLFAAHGRPAARDEFRPAASVEVSVQSTSCEPWVDVAVLAYLDQRWWLAFKATALGQPLRTPIASEETFASKSPSVTGDFAFAVDGHVRDVRATTQVGIVDVPVHRDTDRTRGSLNVYRATIPKSVLASTAINEFLAPGIQLTFQARWASPRSYGTCWITMPQLVGQGSSALYALGGSEGMTGRSSLDEGPLRGRTHLSTRRGSVVREQTEPAPVYSREPEWTCSSRRMRVEELADPPNCASAVAVQKEGADRRAQWLLLLFSGLLSAAVVGCAAGLRQMVLR